MGSGDILANATFTVSPDPIVKGQPLTINMAGDLSAAITAGKLAVDLNIKALGIINEPLKLTVPFTLAPGIPGPGPVTAKIGPFNLPSVPGSVDISGTVTGTDASGAEIFCASLNIALGSVAETPMSEVMTVGAAPVVSNCGAATDHFKKSPPAQPAGSRLLLEPSTRRSHPERLTSISLSRYSSSPSQSRPLCHSPSLPVSLLDRSRFHSVQYERRLRQTPASPSRSTAPSRFPMARHLRLPA